MFDWSGTFQSLSDLIVSLESWQTWVGSDDNEVLAARVSWPIRAAGLSDYPYCNFSPGRATSTNNFGYDASANFKDHGTLMFRLWGLDTNPEDANASFKEFDGKASALLSELITKSHTGPLILTQFKGDEPQITHSHDAAFILGETAEDEPYWHASLEIAWGIN